MDPISTPLSFEENQLNVLQAWNPSRPHEQAVQQQAIQQWKDLNHWRIAKLAEAQIWETQVLEDATKWEDIQRFQKINPSDGIQVHRNLVSSCIQSHRTLVADSIQAARDQLYVSTQSCIQSHL